MEQHRQKLTMHTPTVYRIRVQGVLDESWSSYFGIQAMSVEDGETGSQVTAFTSEPVDQSALVGIISYLSVLRAPLISVENIPNDHPLSD